MGCQFRCRLIQMIGPSRFDFLLSFEFGGMQFDHEVARDGFDFLKEVGGVNGIRDQQAGVRFEKAFSGPGCECAVGGEFDDIYSFCGEGF